MTAVLQIHWSYVLQLATYMNEVMFLSMYVSVCEQHCPKMLWMNLYETCGRAKHWERNK